MLRETQQTGVGGRMARRTGILGGGALGLTLAYRLAAAGDQVTVVEREPEPGGLPRGALLAGEVLPPPLSLRSCGHCPDRGGRPGPPPGLAATGHLHPV